MWSLPVCLLDSFFQCCLKTVVCLQLDRACNKLLNSINQRFLRTSTSIPTLVNLIVGKINDLVRLDITASKRFYWQLNDIYLQNSAYLATSLSKPMEQSAQLLSEAHVIIVDSVSYSGGSLENDTAKVYQLKVCKTDTLFTFINHLKRSAGV
jgi:hypothetical protein